MENLKLLLSKVESHVSAKTVIGEPVQVGEVILVPLVNVSFGMGTGLDTSSSEKKKGDSGGGVVGARMCPAAVIVIDAKGTVQLVNLAAKQESTNKLIDMIPGLLPKIAELFGKKGKDASEEDKKEDEILEETTNVTIVVAEEVE